MKTLRAIIIFVVLALFAALAASCGVTETGNPCPGGGDCGIPATPTAESSQTYRNATYGVSVSFPDGWSADEASDASVVFRADLLPVTNALMEFERLDAAPASFIDYLTSNYEGVNFTTYDTGALDGYYYIIASGGGAGAEISRYFFLGGDVLVVVTAEIYSSGRTAFEELLAGILFE